MLQVNTKLKYLFLFFFNALAFSQPLDYKAFVNTNHLDFLYEDVKTAAMEFGIVHIYSNYPEYKWTGDDDEGIACVDDASRASVFYLKHYLFTGREESLNKNRGLIKFLLYMQSQNGFFYNFIWEDHSINKTYRTSLAEPNFWSWRALWALTEAYHFYKNTDKDFASRIFESVQNLINAVKKNIPQTYQTRKIDGFIRPAWLPYETASDQASILLLGLSQYLKEKEDKVVFEYSRKLAEGIMLMQEGDSTRFPYGAFMSWENLWHGWGNLQSYALLNFNKLTKDKAIKEAALKEIDHFYSYLFPGQCMEFTIKKEDDKIIPVSKKDFPQIAYIIRPMVYASLKAYEITNDSLYARKAAMLASWFFGNNKANKQMYFPENGRCYDGILNDQNLNKNSGAESTIEALLTMIEFDRNPYLKKELNNTDKDKIPTN